VSDREEDPQIDKEKDSPDSSEPDYGCGMTGPGGRWRVILLVVFAVVAVILLVRGFASG